MKTCIDFLIAVAFVIGLLSIIAEIERRDEIAVAQMRKQHLAKERDLAYGKLSARACYMTSCDQMARK